ncbi:amidohydrolase family protein [Curtobacterium sp. MCJR17_043]|uniref:amidohydrolase family protein n=1 Tax=Curtobacterium sp. MCJR17_043 TaxID=2175660 RepID=UPI0024DF756D|nr:amidohydrolase family protein [Curtobacterium sp. MCJR17_043]WIB35439.1 amidohydrolase family protein [Curtobacterium sp. MCJR17_043]
MVVSDHSPSTVDLKVDDWGLAWGGIAGLQVGFRAVWTEAARRGLPLDAVVPAVTTGPAALARFTDRGRIAPGALAHFAVFDPDAESTVRADALAHRNPVSAFDGLSVRGRVTGTWLRGEADHLHRGRRHDRGRGRRRAGGPCLRRSPQPTCTSAPRPTTSSGDGCRVGTTSRSAPSPPGPS